MHNSENAKYNTKPAEIFLRVIVKVEDNAVPLTTDEHRQVPTHFLKTERYEEQYFRIQYEPGSQHTTREKIINTIMKAYKRKATIVKYQEVVPIKEIKI